MIWNQIKFNNYSPRLMNLIIKTIRYKETYLDVYPYWMFDGIYILPLISIQK
jgi:hypothetical protein